MRILTIAEAQQQGYVIDYHAPGRPIGYKGPRFMPDAIVYCFTAYEEVLRRAVMLLCSDEVVTDNAELARQAINNPKEFL